MDVKMCEELENYIINLKENNNFNLLSDKKVKSLNAKEDFYDYETELESDNLKILYVKETVQGYTIADEITVTDKKEDVYTFCNSTRLKNLFNNKPIVKNKFTFNEVKDYIEENA